MTRGAPVCQTADTVATAGATRDGEPRIRMVGIGVLKIVAAPEKLRTVLGSCVGITLFDLHLRIAGLAHSILPQGSEEIEELGKFADQAVDNLVVQLTALGASKTRLRAKLVGGAAMFETANNGTQLGRRNVEAARRRFQAHDIPIIAEAVGGTKGRKVLVDPDTGNVEVAIIGSEPEII